MILRRIATAIRTQNWFTVFIEFALVVAGVLVALQLDNWNQERKNRALELVYLQRLHDDLNRSNSSLQFRLNAMKDSIEAATFVINTLETCTLDPDMRDRFASALFRLGRLAPPFLTDTTLIEMRSTGALGVISEPELVETLIELQRRFELDEISYSSVVLWNADQLAILSASVRYDIQDLRGGFTPVSWEELSFDFEKACSDSALIAAISALRQHAITVARRNELADQRVDKARKILEKSLDDKIPGWRENQ